MPRAVRPVKWAGGTDQLLSGTRFVAAAGEFDMPSVAEVDAALHSIMAAGPHTRVGVCPRPGRRRWRTDGPAPSVVQIPPAIASQGVPAILESVRRQPGRRLPLEVHVGDRYLIADIDHGLGDGRFFIDLVAAIFAVTGGGSHPWVEGKDTTFPLPRSVRHTFIRRPDRLARLHDCATAIRSHLAAGAADDAQVARVPWTASFAVGEARINADTEMAVEQWRRSLGERVGSAAVWLHVAHSAMAAAGLPMTGRMQLAFDCRRYLPPGCSVNSNYVIGLYLPVLPEEPVVALNRRLHRVIDSGAPLVGQAAISMRALVHARQLPVPSTVRPAAPRADVVYTDIGTVPLLAQAPWRNEVNRYIGALIDPAGPQSMTVLSAKVDGCRTVTVSYHDNVFDRGLVDRACALMQQPFQFLDAWQSTECRSG